MFSLLPHRMAWGDGQPSPYKGRRLFPFDLDKLGPLLKINCEHSDSLAFPKQFRKGWGLIGKDFADLHNATFREREEFTPSLLIRENSDYWDLDAISFNRHRYCAPSVDNLTTLKRNIALVFPSFRRDT